MSDYCELPGGGRCTACCRFGDMPALKPPEIQTTPAGDCVYLGENGCTVWPNCPAPANNGFDCEQILNQPRWRAAWHLVPERLFAAALARRER